MASALRRTTTLFGQRSTWQKKSLTSLIKIKIPFGVLTSLFNVTFNLLIYRIDTCCPRYWKKQLCHIRPLDLEKISEAFWEATFEIVIQSLFKNSWHCINICKDLRNDHPWSVIKVQVAKKYEQLNQMNMISQVGFQWWYFGSLFLRFQGDRWQCWWEPHWGGVPVVSQWGTSPSPGVHIFPRLICCKMDWDFYGVFFPVIWSDPLENLQHFLTKSDRIWRGDSSWRRQDQRTLADSQQSLCTVKL